MNESTLLIETYTMIVILKSLLIERLTMEELVPTDSEEGAIDKAEALCLRLRQEIISGPKGS